LTLTSTVLVWLNFSWLAEHASPDIQAAVLLAWSLPLALGLGLRLLAPQRAIALGSRLRFGGSGPSGPPEPAQEITVKPFSRPLSTS
jgi:hypothetical protein